MQVVTAFWSQGNKRRLNQLHLSTSTARLIHHLTVSLSETHCP